MSLVVRDYDEAIDFYIGKLGFELVDDTFQPGQNKRWVVVKPKGQEAAALLLAKATTPEQEEVIGNQSGGRVMLFLSTDDFWRDYNAFVERGVEFTREPVRAEYGTVAVFNDLYGTQWDLIEYAK